MGGIGSHHGHSYAAAAVAFAVSMLMPGSALALVAGAYWERYARRRVGRQSAQAAKTVVLATEWSAE
jgi:hypothetical protein